MQATKNHVMEVAEKYGVEIEEFRPKTNIVQATRKYGVPFVSKLCPPACLDGKKERTIINRAGI